MDSRGGASSAPWFRWTSCWVNIASIPGALTMTNTMNSGDRGRFSAKRETEAGGTLLAEAQAGREDVVTMGGREVLLDASHGVEGERPEVIDASTHALAEAAYGEVAGDS